MKSVFIAGGSQAFLAVLTVFKVLVRARWPAGPGPCTTDGLAAPASERLLFAGEATRWPYDAAVCGAELSVLMEAGRLGVLPLTTPGLADREYTPDGGE